MSIRPIYVCSLMVTAVLGTGCDVHVGENGVSLDVTSGKATDEWTRSYTVTKGGSVEVTNTNGQVIVELATGPQVEVVAKRQARASSDEEAQSLLQKVEIKEEVSAGRVTIQTSAPPLTFGRRSASVEYRLKVPAGLQVAVKTENGGIVLTDISGGITASTTNGGIRGKNLSGSLTAHIVNGGIVVEVARVSGPIELDAVNGGIRLDIPPNANADIQAHAVNGGVSTDDGMTLAGVERSRNSVTGKMNAGGIKVSATTVNGGVRIGTRIGVPTNQTGEADFDEHPEVLVEKR